MEGPVVTGRYMGDGPHKSIRGNGDSRSAAGIASPKHIHAALGKHSFEHFASGDDTSQYGQSLASVLNNPHLGKSGIYTNEATWGTWLFPSSTDSSIEVVPPPLLPGTLEEVVKADFQPYLDSISESYSKFVDVQHHATREQSNDAVAEGGSDTEPLAGQGEGLKACLREIPSLYFDENFALEKGSTFQAACPFSSIPQNMMLQERLSHYLDLVEVHLVKEISAKSDSFFEALDQLEDLNGRIVGACDQIHELQASVHLLDNNLLEPARHIQTLETRRDDLLGLHQKLKLVAYVNQAVSAMRLLVEAADCAGALDVIDNLQHLLGGDELVGLHCFRHLGDDIASAVESVISTLSADFVRGAVLNSADLEASAILTKFHTKERGPISFVKQSEYSEIREGEDDENALRDQLLPILIGLLRTSKMPAVLRVYKETLSTDIKTAIRTIVAELLPVLSTRAAADDLPSADRQADMEVGGVSLASKLRSLSAESFVRLLHAVFVTVQARLVRAAEVRVVIEQVIGGLQGSYAAAAVAAAFASGAKAVAAAEAAQDRRIGSSSTRSLSRVDSRSVPQQFRADVLRENTEAVWATCDAAHGRWAKLLGVRALIHPKLRLQEFVTIYEITQEFITATEKVGGRLGYSIRGTLQSQSKSFVDHQHATRISKITAVLDQEIWVAVDAPDEFQTIVAYLTTTDVSSDGKLATSEGDSLQSAGSLDSDNAEAPKAEEKSVPESNGQAPVTENSADQEPLVETSVPGGGDSVTGTKSSTESTSPPEGGDSSIVNLSSTPPSGPSPGISRPSETGTTKGKKMREKALQVRGTSYHCVNCGLILLKMIAEYIDIANALPSLATEVVHRVAEILKLYNSRSCQLVLGAGAMQVSGLKTITTKHLALASQSISFFYALIPDIRRLLAVQLPEARKALLLTEIDRVGQDYRVHRDEIYSKLVAIMKERLQAHLRTLPQVVENWNRPGEDDTQASPYARFLTKEVGLLHRILAPLLPDTDMRSIFTRVVLLFHSHVADAFSKLEVSTPDANRRLYRDAQLILACVHGLPSNNVDAAGSQKPGQLDELLTNKFGGEPPP